MSELDAIKAAGLNSEAHSALLLERHKCAARMELLLEMVRKERADLERLDGELKALERRELESSQRCAE